MSKLTVAVLFGGRSTEHEISKISAMNVISHMSTEKYIILPIYITKDGEWLLYDGGIDGLKNVNWEKQGIKCVLSPDTKNNGLIRIVGDKTKSIPLDVVFPVLHGRYGEDGCIQGLCELADVAYVGAGVLSSAVCLDKAFTKIVVKALGIPQADYITTHFRELTEDFPDLKGISSKVRRKIGYPCFVKPANSGSSIGIKKAADKEQLVAAIPYAMIHDPKIVIEKAINGRELECAVLGRTGFAKASRVGEIVAGGEFYDFESKYESKNSQTITSPVLPEEVSEQIRKYAVEIFNSLDCSGLARVDFFWDEEKNKIYFNEINTLPGFTGISMFAMLWGEEGLKTEDLIDELIEIALHSARTRKPAVISGE